MPDGQNLDNLLITIDSEIGDLKGINSAITALQRLSNITGNAKGAIKQLSTLGDALQHFNGLGYKLSGLNEAEKGIHKMITALQRLTQITGSAQKATNQLGKLGETLNTSFSGIGKNLAGIEEVSRGVLNLVSSLEKLSNISGNVKGKTQNLGSLAIQLSSLNGINLKDVADNICDPLDRIMKSIGNLGTNNRISIRIDQSGVAKVNQIQTSTKKAMSSWQDFYNTLQQDMQNLDLGDLFDLTQPVDVLERNLGRAQRSLASFENNARTNAEKVRTALSSFTQDQLENNLSFRNAYRGRDMSQAYAQAYRQNIDAIKQQIDSINTGDIQSAWRHTIDSIRNDIGQFNLGDLINTNLPLDEMRANLRTMQNELSRAQSAMERSLTNIRRINSEVQDVQARQGDSGYRGSIYTYATQAEYVNRYADAIRHLNAVIAQQERLPQSDVEGLRMLPQLEDQLRRYSSLRDDLLNQDNLSDDAQRNLAVYQDGIDIIIGRIESVRNQLEQIQPTEDGIIERMRQIAAETERVNLEMAQQRNASLETVSSGFSQFGNALSGLNLPVIKELGNLSSLFGKNGTRFLSTESLAGLEGIASTLGTAATAIGQVTAVIGILVAEFKLWWNAMGKAKDLMLQFTQSCIQFAKNMLSKVVGAFNAVIGAVSKMVSAVRSGAEAITAALRKVGEVGQKIISIFSKIGGAVSSAMKGIKVVLSAVTPRFIKNLSLADGSLKSIIKNTKVLNKLIQVANKWFTMLSRMLMRKIVQAFISSLKQAFEDMVLFEKNANDEMLRLNYNVSRIFSGIRRVSNQLMAIFEPLINAISTPMENFFDTLSAMGENLAKFMAILTGQPYYLRAKKFYEDYGQNVEDTNKKVKNLTNGLDELNILNDNKDSGNQISPEDMFEKVPVEGGLLEFPTIDSILDAIIDWLKNLDWDAIKEKVKNFIDRLMDIINEALKKLDLWAILGKTLAELFNTLMEAWNAFIKKFDPQATEKALSTFIINALRGIDWKLINENVELTAKKFAEFWNAVFADNELWNEIVKALKNLLNEITHYFNTWAWTFDFKQMAKQLTSSITKLLKEYDYEQLRSAVEGWVKGIVDFFNEVVADKEFWKTLGDSLAKIINATIIEGLKQLGNLNLVEFSDSIKLAITSAIDGIKWDELEASIEKLAQNLVDAINDFFTDQEFLTKVTTALAGIGNIILNAIKTSITGIKGEEIAKAIANALITGLSLIDWEKVFTLPADAINLLSNALEGLLDSIPKDFNLGTWLTEHLELTLDEIDWDKLEKNLEKLGEQISNFITGALQNQEFWEKFGIATGKVIKIGLDFIFDVFNINGEDLGNAIATYINKLVQNVDLGEYLSKTVDIALNLLVALDITLTGVDWEAIGDQIGRGIADAVQKIYDNRALIQKTIEDAFSSFSTLVNRVLKKMINTNSFYKIGQTLGNIVLGIINGLSEFFAMNSKEIVKAMKQFASGLADFINEHEDEIVNGLNTIIDGIVDIIDGFFDAKGKLFNAINKVIERLHLGKLIGSLLGIVIRGFTAALKQRDAIFAAIKDDLDALVDELYKAFKGLLSYIWEDFKKRLFQKPFELTGGGLLGFIKDLFGGEVDLSSIFGGLKFTGLGDALNTLKEKIGGVKDWFKEKVSGIGDWWKGLFGGDKEEKVTIPVEYEVDDSEADSWNDLFDKKKKIPVELEDPTLGTITASKIDVDEIYADVLYVGEIFADVLHIGEIDGELKDSNVHKQDKYYAERPQDATGGVLTNELDKINSAFDGIGSKIKDAIKSVDWKSLGNKLADGFLHGFDWSPLGRAITDNINKNIKVTYVTSGGGGSYSGGTTFTGGSGRRWTDMIGGTSAEDYLNTGRKSKKTSKNTTSNSTENHIWNRLMDVIGNPNGVAGLMGNLVAESGLNPNNLQNSSNKKLGLTDDEYVKLVNSGQHDFVNDNAGFGLAQWTTPDRKKAFLDSLNGRSVDDLDAQLDFLISELQDKYKGVLDKLKNADSVAEASDAVLKGFEKPKNQDDSVSAKRAGYGENILDRYGASGDGLQDAIDDLDLQKAIDKINWDKLADTIGKAVEDALKKSAGSHEMSSSWLAAGDEGQLPSFLDELKDFDFAEEFFGKDDKKKIGKDLVALRKNIKDFLKDVLSDIQNFKNKVKDMFDDLVKNFLDGLNEKADEELQKTLRTIRHYIDWMKEAIEDFNKLLFKMFEGLSNAATEELSKTYNIVKRYFGLMKDEVELFKKALKGMFAGINEQAQLELEKTLETLKNYLRKMKEAIDDFNEALRHMFDGMVDAAKEELELLLAFLKDYLGLMKDELEPFHLEAIGLFDGLADNALKELDKTYNTLKDYLAKMAKELRNFHDQLLKLFDGLADMAKLELERTLGYLRWFLQLMQDEIDKFNRKIKLAFDGLSKAAEDELKKTLDILKKYFDEFTKMFDDFNKKVKLAFDGLAKAAEEELQKAKEIIEKYLNEFIKMFEDFNDKIKLWFNGLADAAEEELTKAEEVIKNFFDRIAKLFDELHEKMLKWMEGLADAANDELEKAYNIIKDWLDRIIKLFADFILNDFFGGLAEQAEKTMAQIYDIIDIWLGRIAELLASFNPNVLAGLAEAFKAELDKMWLYFVDWANKVKARINEIFKDMMNVINGQMKITLEIIGAANTDHLDNNTNAKSKNTKAVEANTQALRDFINKGLTCNCNCGGGNGGTTVDNSTHDQHLINNTNAKSENTKAVEANTKALRDFINSCCGSADTTHLDNNTKAKSENTKAVEALNNNMGGFIDALRSATSNITCNCNCNCNCGSCGMGGNNSGSGNNNGGNGSNTNDLDNGGGNNGNNGGNNGGNNTTNDNGNGGDNGGNVHDESGHVPNEHYYGDNNGGGEGGTINNPNNDNSGGNNGNDNNGGDNGQNNGDNNGQNEDNQQENENKPFSNDKLAVQVPTGQFYDEDGKSYSGLNEYWMSNIGGKAYSDWLKARDEQNAEVENYRNEAQPIYDWIMANGTDNQKNQAQSYYDYLMNNQGALGTSTYKNALETLRNIKTQKTGMDNPEQLLAEAQKMLDEVLNNPFATKQQKADAQKYFNNLKWIIDGTYPDTLGTGISQFYNALKTEHDKVVGRDVDDLLGDSLIYLGANGKLQAYSGGTVSSLPSRDTLATAIFYGKDLNGKNVNWFVGGYGADNTVTGQEAEQVKEFLKKKYGITEADIPEGYKYGDTQSQVEPTDDPIIAGIKNGETAKVKYKNPSDTGMDCIVTSGSSSQNFFPTHKDKIIENKGLVKEITVGDNYVTYRDGAIFNQVVDAWIERLKVKGYQMGGLPSSGEIFISRENGTPEFVGSFGNRTAVANNDQIVTAVANGVSMANDRLVSAIESQTTSLENAIDKKDVDVVIGDRQIAEANRRGQKSIGDKFID